MIEALVAVEQFHPFAGGEEMMRGAWMVVMLGLLAESARAQPAFPIQFKDPGPGEVVEVNRTEDSQSHVRVLDMAGKVVLDRADKKLTTVLYQETALVKEPGKLAERLRRRYAKAQVQAGGKTISLPYEGKTVLIEKRDGKYRFVIEGGDALAAQDAPLLESEFNSKRLNHLEMRKVLLPTKPVRVDESWTIDPSPLIRDLAQADGGALTVDREKAAASGRLLAVRDQEGRRFGKVTFTADLPLTELRQGEKRVPVQPGTKLSLAKTMEGCMDGSVVVGSMSAVIQLDASSLLDGGAQGRVLLTNRASIQETQREVPGR
jgi:hypothetical protein